MFTSLISYTSTKGSHVTKSSSFVEFVQDCIQKCCESAKLLTHIVSNKYECQALLAHLVVHLVYAYNVFVCISGTWDGTANLLSELLACDFARGITSHKVNAHKIKCHNGCLHSNMCRPVSVMRIG